MVNSEMCLGGVNFNLPQTLKFFNIREIWDAMDFNWGS